MTAKVVLGYREYAALPDDGRRYEILDGELSVTPAPSLDHQIILANLFGSSMLTSGLAISGSCSSPLSTSS
jgi:hypothetical protein